MLKVIAARCGAVRTAVQPLSGVLLVGLLACAGDPQGEPIAAIVDSGDEIGDAGGTARYPEDAGPEGGIDAGPDAAGRVGGTFFSYNICGADSKCKVAAPTTAVVTNVVAHRPLAFALQEVCSGQADQISVALRAKGLHYVQRFQNTAPTKVNLGCGGLQGWGNAVFHAGDVLGIVEENAFRSQGGLTRAQDRSYVCVRVPVPDFWACSTHIDTDATQQKPQIDELSRVLGRLGTVGGKPIPIVIGGDFNASPESASLDSMFAPSYVRGSGELFERDVRTNRSIAAASATDGTKKIDYVFHSSAVTAVSSTVVVATSDHRLVLNQIELPSK